MKKLFILLALFFLASCDQQSTFTSTPIPAPTDTLPDFSSFTDVKEKKQNFFEFLLPLIYASNQNIMQERQLAQHWIDNPQQLNDKQRQAFSALLTKYRITDSSEELQKQQLLERINIIPPSLVLAQAANESAWGSSRFAKEGNNLFGQWCYEIGCGIIPGERNHRAKHEVKVFKTPYESVASYMRNLNSHPQYEDLRTLRTQQLEQGNTITGQVLAQGLIGYSERREAYVEEIQLMIRHNQLEEYDLSPLGKVLTGN